MRLFHLRIGAHSAIAGMTLVETMVCLLIVGVLASLAGPAWRDLLQRQRVATVRTELTSAMQLARWEAVRRNAPVALQRRIDCGALLATVHDWSCGWDVQAALPDEARTLQRFVPPPGVRLTHPGGGPAMEFGRSGVPVLVAHKFVIAPAAEVTPMTTVLCVNRTGRVRTVTGTATC
ncbi:GspH/FimT family pseudopilin [Pseudorhodoferax sp. Leaf265]|uniref:GspH/FimT family pseudopilin n=1 Tax=Pseudorhodoferax sp. Leaf265 TaxID=1736315 RepID=UPI0009E85936|nr:GspH/FimT family pseudopilin [Pseudorhodoferax sp. Leaf265]